MRGVVRGAFALVGASSLLGAGLAVAAPPTGNRTAIHLASSVYDRMAQSEAIYDVRRGYITFHRRPVTERTLMVFSRGRAIAIRTVLSGAGIVPETYVRTRAGGFRRTRRAGRNCYVRADRLAPHEGAIGRRFIDTSEDRFRSVIQRRSTFLLRYSFRWAPGRAWNQVEVVSRRTLRMLSSSTRITGPRAGEGGVSTRWTDRYRIVPRPRHTPAPSPRC